MAIPAVTYTFVNGTDSDAGQVNQNFSDLIAGATDGTKSYSIAALTCSQSATFQAGVSVGSSSADDFTLTASLAASVSIKTNATYDFGGATTGLLSLYIGSSSTFTCRIKSAATASWTLTLPVTGGTANYILSTDGNGATSWVRSVADTSSSCGTFSGIATSATLITNLTRTIVTTGKDVLIHVQNDGSGNNGVFGISKSSDTANGAVVIKRDGTTISIQRLYISAAGVGNIAMIIPCSSITHIDVAPTAASHVYTVNYFVFDSGVLFQAEYCKLHVRELF